MVILIHFTGLKITLFHLRYFRMDNFDAIEISMRLWLWSTPNIFEIFNVIYLHFVNNGGLDSVTNNKIFSNLLFWKWIKVTLCHVMRFSLMNYVVNQSGPRNQWRKKAFTWLATSTYPSGSKYQPVRMDSLYQILTQIQYILYKLWLVYSL